VGTELIRGIHNVTTKHRGCVVTIGNFDGVHKGHQVLLSQVKERAMRLGVPSMVITFEPQPMEFFAKERSVARLTRCREKFFQLAQWGIDKVLIIRFNAEFAALSAEAFAENLLGKQLGIKEVIVGHDFHFGRGRQGDVSLLKKAAARLGFVVDTIPNNVLDGERISSTRVRQALYVADLALTEKLLGRPYSMKGRVVYGDQRGRVLGFPTANIYLHRHVSPILGIYVVRLHGIGNKPLPGVANIGVRPTIGTDSRTLLEVHVFNFNQTIYGRQVCVEFCKKLRDEERFANLDLLKEQMLIDAEQARMYFIERGEMSDERV
jgi:riboflavin kinase/FMN adenylyltransferase